MRTFEASINSWEKIQEQVNKNSINDTISNVKLSIWWVLEWKKYNEKNEIKISSREQLSDIFENSHLTVEQELGKEFWLNEYQLKDIEADFKKPLTVADVLDEWEAYWERLNFSSAVNDEVYWIAA